MSFFEAPDYQCPLHPHNNSYQVDGIITPCCGKGHHCKEEFIDYLVRENIKLTSNYNYLDKQLFDAWEKNENLKQQNQQLQSRVNELEQLYQEDEQFVNGLFLN